VVGNRVDPYPTLFLAGEVSQFDIQSISLDVALAKVQEEQAIAPDQKPGCGMMLLLLGRFLLPGWTAADSPVVRQSRGPCVLRYEDGVLECSISVDGDPGLGFCASWFMAVIASITREHSRPRLAAGR
jgi:hypothetical protein